MLSEEVGDGANRGTDGGALPPGLAALPWLAVSVRLAKRRCLAFAPPPSSPGCDGPKCSLEPASSKESKLVMYDARTRWSGAPPEDVTELDDESDV